MRIINAVITGESIKGMISNDILDYSFNTIGYEIITDAKSIVYFMLQDATNVKIDYSI